MLLSACGFHLRGDYLLPDDVNQLSLTSYDEYSTLTKDLRKQLTRNGIEIVPPSSQVPNLHLIKESDGDTTVSIYQNSRAAEKQLNYSVQYRITIPGESSQTFSTSVTRSYLDNPQASLAKSIEEDLLLDEMRQQASQQILRQMARLKADPDAVTNTPAATGPKTLIQTDPVDETQDDAPSVQSASDLAAPIETQAQTLSSEASANVSAELSETQAISSQPSSTKTMDDLSAQ